MPMPHIVTGFTKLNKGILAGLEELGLATTPDAKLEAAQPIRGKCLLAQTSWALFSTPASGAVKWAPQLLPQMTPKQVRTEC